MHDGRGSGVGAGADDAQDAAHDEDAEQSVRARRFAGRVRGTTVIRRSNRARRRGPVDPHAVPVSSCICSAPGFAALPSFGVFTLWATDPARVRKGGLEFGSRGMSPGIVF